MINDFNNLGMRPGLSPGFSDPASEAATRSGSDAPASWFGNLDAGSALPISADATAANAETVAELASQVLSYLGN